MRRDDFDAQGVNVGLHHVTEGLVNKPVCCERFKTGQSICPDADAKVSAAFFGALVADVEMTFVHDLEQRRLQRSRQAFADSVGPIHGQGKTYLKGLSVNPA